MLPLFHTKRDQISAELISEISLKKGVSPLGRVNVKLLDSLTRGRYPVGQVFASWDVVHTDLRREYRVLRLPGARGVRVIY